MPPLLSYLGREADKNASPTLLLPALCGYAVAAAEYMPPVTVTNRRRMSGEVMGEAMHMVRTRHVVQGLLPQRRMPCRFSLPMRERQHVFC